MKTELDKKNEMMQDDRFHNPLEKYTPMKYAPTDSIDKLFAGYNLTGVVPCGYTSPGAYSSYETAGRGVSQGFHADDESDVPQSRGNWKIIITIGVIFLAGTFLWMWWNRGEHEELKSRKQEEIERIQRELMERETEGE